MKNSRDEHTIKLIGERVRALRIERNLTMEKLAAMADMEYMQISNVELGQFDPTVSTLSAICKALEISLHELTEAGGLR